MLAASLGDEDDANDVFGGILFNLDLSKILCCGLETAFCNTVAATLIGLPVDGDIGPAFPEINGVAAAADVGDINNGGNEPFVPPVTIACGILDTW